MTAVIKQPQRGMLTEEAITAFSHATGYLLDTRALRLLPFIQYQAMNDRKISARFVNDAEFQILNKWQAMGLIQFTIGCDDLAVAPDFWRLLNEIMLMTYVPSLTFTEETTI